MSSRFCLVDNYLTREDTSFYPPPVKVEEFGRDASNNVFISDFRYTSKSDSTYLTFKPLTVLYEGKDVGAVRTSLEETGLAVRFTRGEISKTYILRDETFVSFNEYQEDDINDIMKTFYPEVSFKTCDIVHYRPLETIYRNVGYFYWDGNDNRFHNLDDTYDEYGHLPLELMEYFKPNSSLAYNMLEDGTVITSRGFGYYLDEVPIS